MASVFQSLHPFSVSLHLKSQNCPIATLGTFSKSIKCITSQLHAWFVFLLDKSICQIISRFYTTALFIEFPSLIGQELLILIFYNCTAQTVVPVLTRMTGLYVMCPF